MRLIKKITKRFLQFLLLIFIVANLFIILSGRFYLYKGVLNTYFKGRSGPSIYDKDIFANSTIKKANEIYKWNVSDKKVELNKYEEKVALEQETSSLIVIKNDTIIFEKYWGDHNQGTVSNSFSATKTFISLLVGIAIEEGKIKSLDEPVSTYLKSFKEKGKDKITVRHLLMMASGLDWEESGKNPLSENAESYYGTDLWGLVNRQKAISKPGVNFNYQSGNSQLLGYIIEKATNQDLSKYAYEKIWSQIGTEHDALWSLDKENGDEKAFCCLYGTSRDFARLGRLILNKGKWNGKQIVSEKYMQEMFANPEMKTEENIPNYRYGLHIWTYLGEKNPVYYCRGILGQYIISIPAENLVIVRTGMKRMKNIETSENKFKIGHPADLFLYISTAKRLAKNK
ncbi:MAG: serine hydrolase domain-containing protein [Flavobacteriia bacterium]|jgi:CubicO group peptidase (beta-lactamase class C family)